MVEDFADFDHNGDGRVDDDDLLFAVTLRSGFPDRNLVIDDCNNTYLAFFAQDDWRVTPRADAEPRPALGDGHGRQERERLRRHEPAGAATSTRATARPTGTTSARASASTGRAPGGRLGVHGGWGIYYDRITLEITSLERGLDGRALPIEVKAGNVFFLDPQTGQFPPFAPSLAQPVHRLRAARRRARRASTSSTTRCSPRRCSSGTSAPRCASRSDVFVRVDGV